MKLLVSTTLALTVVMPALACDEHVSPPAAPSPGHVMAAQAPPVHAVAPPPPVFAAAIGLLDDESNSVVTIVDTDGDQRVEIKIENENIAAKVNGETVPEGRIVRTDERIVILDENGKEIYSTRLRYALGPNALRGFTVQGNAPFHAYNDWLAGADVDVEMPKVMLGVHMESPGPALESQLRLDADATTLINGVYEGLPGHAAGIEPYDIIVSIGNIEKADPDSLRGVLKSLEPGSTLELGVIRGGERQQIEVTLDSYDSARMRDAKLHGTAGNSVHFQNGPGTINRFFYTDENAPGAIVIDPQRFSHTLRNRSMAIADDLRRQAMDHVRDLNIDEESIHEQIEALRERLDEVTEMLHEMIDEAAKARDEALGENET